MENISMTDSKTESQDSIDTKTLSKLFDKGFGMYTNLDKMTEPTNSPEVQSEIRRIMTIFEDATRLVSCVDMFSENEEFEEVTTENIKYFLLPALLGMLTTKVCRAEDRLNIVDVCEIYFVDFLKRCKAYGLIDIEIPDVSHKEDKEGKVVLQQSNAQMISDMVNRRNNKINRYKEQKELEKHLDMLKKTLDSPNVDDESKRNYFVTLIKIFVNQIIDELGSLATERMILNHAKAIGEDPNSEPKPATQLKKKPQITSLKPIIITRDDVQKKVYGAGYPSLPVLTVDEFYEKRVKEGDWPDPSKRNQIGTKSLQDFASGKIDARTDEEQEEIKKEDLIEQDDPESLERARAFDEYKDTHRRGWGNRANRS